MLVGLVELGRCRLNQTTLFSEENKTSASLEASKRVGGFLNATNKYLKRVSKK